eukprot:IDg10864t1
MKSVMVFFCAALASVSIASVFPVPCADPRPVHLRNTERFIDVNGIFKDVFNSVIATPLAFATPSL